MEASNKYSNQRSPGREHFPLYPKGFIGIRILQLVLAVVVLGLSAFGVAVLVFSGDCLILFTAIATIISCIYYIVAEFGAPKLFNYWAVLSLDIFLVIFWLISFALLAAEVAPYMNGYTTCDYYYGCYTTSLSGSDKIYAACLAAAAGLGGLEFVVFIVSLAIHSAMLHRHRKAGLHCTPVALSNAQVATASGEKVGTQPQTQPQVQQHQQQNLPPLGHPQQPQPSYTGQPTPPAQQVYGAPQQQYYPQQIPQQAPSPLSAQPTGLSVQQQPVQHQTAHPAPGPYETHGQSVQHSGQ
ncbi:hypothetical protein SCAR479_03271 [Seiridium cardinale]|uniref:MARVEL domain-containing protein n=1 Tax=Seiridium cardinale TaxID=138064 RepID=A0ABR2Y1B2_9PEZI